MQFLKNKTLISYDLSNNDISASEICKHSSFLRTSAANENDRNSLLGLSSRFDLPNTTIVSTIASREEAKKEFENAFAQAKSRSYSYAKITKLFVVEIFGKDAIIENN